MPSAAKELMKSLCSLFIFIILSHEALASENVLQNLWNQKRFGDIYAVSLSGMVNAKDKSLNIHRRNVARASLMIGDFNSSIFFLDESLQSNNPLNLDLNTESILLAYNYLLLEDLAMWRKIVNDTKFGVSEERIAVVEAIDGPPDPAAERRLYNLLEQEVLPAPEKK